MDQKPVMAALLDMMQELVLKADDFGLIHCGQLYFFYKRTEGIVEKGKIPVKDRLVFVQGKRHCRRIAFGFCKQCGEALVDKFHIALVSKKQEMPYFFTPWPVQLWHAVREERNGKMTDDLFERAPVPRAYFKLALPVVFSMVISLVYNMVDTFFIARTQNTSIVAEVSLCAPVFTLMIALGDIFGLGGSSVISRLFGQKKVAAMGIAMKVNMIVMLIMVGFAFGAQPLIGYNYGAENRERLRKIIRFDLCVELVFSVVCAGLLALCAPQIMGIFMKDAAVIAVILYMQTQNAAKKLSLP